MRTSRRIRSSRQAHCHTYCEALEARVLMSASRIIGYLPDYYYDPSKHVDFSKMTHVNYFAIATDATGHIAIPPGSYMANPAFLSNLDAVVAAAHAVGTKVNISVYDYNQDSWQTGSQSFSPMAHSAAASTTFANTMVAFCATHHLDGIDLDWEPVATADQTAYGQFLDVIHPILAAHGLTLSASVAPFTQDIPAAKVNADLDWLSPMTYEMAIPNHATYQDAITSMNMWLNWGVPKDKLVMGVPFYAHSTQVVRPYNDIVNIYHPAPGVDSVDGYYFNGINTIASKAQYVQQNGLGGLMIWDVMEDHFDAQGNYTAYSLLPALKQAMDANAPQPPQPADSRFNVTVNQAATQSDPTSDGTVHFTVVFDHPVFDFTINDITLGGTAGATTVAFTGNGATYDIAVSGMSQTGTVTASIVEGRDHDADGNYNRDSISTDNTIQYVAPTQNALPTIHLDTTYAGLVSGWVVDTTKPWDEVWVNLFIDNQLVTGRLAGDNRPALQAIYGSSDHGFSFAPARLAAGAHTFKLEAYDTTTGDPISQSWTVTIDPANHAPIGNIELANRTTLKGWLGDTDTPTTPVQFRYVLDGVTSTWLTANADRPDLGALFSDTHHGFSAGIGPLAAGRHTVLLYARDTSTLYQSLVTWKTFTLPSLYLGSIDRVTTTAISGWAFTSAQVTGNTKVLARVDGKFLPITTATQQRQDLQATLGTATAGYTFILPTALAHGTHTVSLWLLNPLTNTWTTLASRTVTV